MVSLGLLHKTTDGILKCLVISPSRELAPTTAGMRELTQSKFLPQNNFGFLTINQHTI